jgi:hypothetical protein
VALYATAEVTDTVGKEGLDERLGLLQVAGVPAELIDSRQSDRLADGESGFWVLLQDGFADLAAARAACELHRDVAPSCSAVPPR